ncbi:MAG TPA: glycosyltransferase [Chthoniobacterales bacterium]|nr:glycosyltransferase [Chthoniobacterales bacterium]
MDKPNELIASRPDVAQRPLRILIVVNLPWDERLGAVRVWIELAKQWTSAGHLVEKFCLTDAFPRPTDSGGLSSLRLIRFPRRAARHVRENGHRFDIIDALTGTLPFSKKRLGFYGLVVSRSVGLYRSYEKFTRSIKRRWPDEPRGKFLGPLFYSFINWKMARLSDRSVRRCDLINVPNEEELTSLQETGVRNKPIIVQPYGLNQSDRAAFASAAQSSAERLKNKEIVFIGMWSLRKGSRDWPDLIGRIRSVIPDAKFTFLGTMTDDRTLRADLQASALDNVRHVPSFDPKELPNLLASGTVGVFPSYIEGFGLAVLEQLAAGIPTVAYDVPGPRQILKSFGNSALVPAGNTFALAARAIEILRADLTAYERLRQGSVDIAAKYSWPEIAEATLRTYRRTFDAAADAIVFTHPFGLQSPSGGSRIMRALLEQAPYPFISVATSPDNPPATNLGPELHVPLRPAFGRIERTRLAGLADSIAPLFAKRFARQLEAICRRTKTVAIHSIAHGGLDFYTGLVVARKLSVPYFLQVHDDFIFSARGVRSEATAHGALQHAWTEAAACFVVCRALGEEYSRRYGQRDYIVITDGVERVASSPRQRSTADLRIYFMGLFHLDYEPNLKVLLNALARLNEEKIAGKISITLRCGGLRPGFLAGYEKFVRVLPFASEAIVQSDMEQADLLYLPLPFETKYESFVRFSLSTKMVTYLGSGIPILYHGPGNSAVHKLLEAHNAALLCTRPASEDLLSMLRRYVSHPESGTDMARNALALARNDFMLDQIRTRFWNAVANALKT